MSPAHRPSKVLAGAVIVAALGAACVAPPPTKPVIDPGDGGHYMPDTNPVGFVHEIDNPYLPLQEGAHWVYEGTEEGKPSRIEVRVTGARREITGIDAVVVRDTVTVDNQVIEDTFDWFAQDVKGNVWYLGEAVKDFENGKLVSTAGSWEAGVDGALPGIAMLGQRRVGRAYRQEFARGEAEDMAEIAAVDAHAWVPFGAFVGVVQTTEWTPLEPEFIERKQYAPGVGMIRTTLVAGGSEDAQLVSFTPGD